MRTWSARLSTASLLLLAACGTATPLRPASTAMSDRVGSLTRHACAPGIAQALESMGARPDTVRQIVVRASAPQEGAASPSSYDAYVLFDGAPGRVVNLDFTCRPVSASAGADGTDALRFTGSR